MQEERLIPTSLETHKEEVPDQLMNTVIGSLLLGLPLQEMYGFFPRSL